MAPYSGATMRILVAVLLASDLASAAAVPRPDIHARNALPIAKDEVKTTLVSDADSGTFLSDLKEFLSRYDVGDVFANTFAKLFGGSSDSVAPEGAGKVEGEQQDTTTWDFFPPTPETTTEALVQTLVVEPVPVESFSSTPESTLLTITSLTTSEEPTVESPEPTSSESADFHILPIPFPIETTAVSDDVPPFTEETGIPEPTSSEPDVHILPIPFPIETIAVSLNATLVPGETELPEPTSSEADIHTLSIPFPIQTTDVSIIDDLTVFPSPPEATDLPLATPEPIALTVTLTDDFPGPTAISDPWWWWPWDWFPTPLPGTPLPETITLDGKTVTWEEIKSTPETSWWEPESTFSAKPNFTNIPYVPTFPPIPSATNESEEPVPTATPKPVFSFFPFPPIPYPWTPVEVTVEETATPTSEDVVVSTSLLATNLTGLPEPTDFSILPYPEPTYEPWTEEPETIYSPVPEPTDSAVPSSEEPIVEISVTEVWTTEVWTTEVVTAWDPDATETSSTSGEEEGTVFSILPFPLPTNSSVLILPHPIETETPLPPDLSSILVDPLPSSDIVDPEGETVITFTLPSQTFMPEIHILPFPIPKTTIATASNPEETESAGATTERGTSTTYTYITRTVTPLPFTSDSPLAFSSSASAAPPYPTTNTTTPSPPTFETFSLLRLCASNPSIFTLTLPLLSRFYGPNAYPSLHPFPGCSPPLTNSSQAIRAPGLLNCTSLGQEVSACQKLGKKILLSVRGDSVESVAGNLDYGDPNAPGEDDGNSGPFGPYFGFAPSPTGSLLDGRVSNRVPNLFDSYHPPSSLALTLFSLFSEGSTERPDLRPLGPLDASADPFTSWSKPLGEEVVVDGFDVQVPREWEGTWQGGQFEALVDRLRELSDDSFKERDRGAEGVGIVVMGWV